MSIRYIEKTQNRFLHAKGQLGLRQPARAEGPTEETRAKGLQGIRLFRFVFQIVSGLIANVWTEIYYCLQFGLDVSRNVMLCLNFNSNVVLTTTKLVICVQYSLSEFCRNLKNLS